MKDCQCRLPAIRHKPLEPDVGSAQEASYNYSGAGEIDDPCVACAERGHNLADVLDAGCPNLGNDCRCRLLDLGFLELAGQEALDDSNLFTFLLGKVMALALLVKRDRFATLLNHRLQDLLDLGFGDTLDVALSAGGDITLLERGQHQAHGRNAPRIPSFECLFEPIGEGLTQRRHAPPRVQLLSLSCLMFHSNLARCP